MLLDPFQAASDGEGPAANQVARRTGKGYPCHTRRTRRPGPKPQAPKSA